MEKWKDVVGWEGLYKVSNKGRVKTRKGKIMKHNIPAGYAIVRLQDAKNKRAISKGVHRLVAESFIPNIENKRTVDHIDNNKLNNKVENLQWMTYSENIKKAWREGLCTVNVPKNQKGEKHPMSKFTWNDIKDMRAMYNNGIKQSEIAKKYNMPFTYVWSIVHNKNWVDENYTPRERKSAKVECTCRKCGKVYKTFQSRKTKTCSICFKNNL